MRSAFSLAASAISIAAMLAAADLLVHFLLPLQAPATPCPQGRDPIWSDEFNAPAQTPPDPTRWDYDLGRSGWGNNEVQTYTNSIANSFHDGQGHLVIRAVREDTGFTSARIVTRGRFTFQYGRVEARMRVPYEKGVWPAFWMLGAPQPDDTPQTATWEAKGEADIMESFGAQNGDASRIHAAIHGPGYAGKGIAGDLTLPDGQHFADDFHLFALEWGPTEISFSVDGITFHTIAREDVPPGGWVFDHPFYLLANVAVGGFPAPVGYPSLDTPFPQDLVLDSIRVCGPSDDETG
jgi:beta-glucanase (GH16 family)